MLPLLVATVCKALQTEDDFLRKDIIGNPTYADQNAGIRRRGFLDGRYYQRLVAGQFFTWPYQINLETLYHDLVLIDAQSMRHFAAIGMKLWMDRRGDLAGIVLDIDKLRKSTLEPQYRTMLIFSANPNTETASAIDYFSSELLEPPAQVVLLRGQNFEVEMFHTNSDDPSIKNLPMDFWVAGIEV